MDQRSRLATSAHRRRSNKANEFFKIAERGNDKSDADVTWYIEQEWVDVNVQDKLECNAAHYAVAKNRPDLLVSLVRHGIDINHPNKRGRTPLHTAAEKGRAAMIDILMEHGAAEAMATYDKEGNTPFHVAVKNLEVQAVRAFLRHGADRLHPTQDGQAPKDLAGTANRNLQLLGAVCSLLTTTSQRGDSVATLGLSPQQSVDSDLSGWETRSALPSMRPDVRDQHTAWGQATPVWPGTPAASSLASTDVAANNSAQKPENMVLVVHLVRKIIPMLAAAEQFCAAPPDLQFSLTLVEHLINSLHRVLCRLHPPGDIEPHLNPMLSTLVEMWRVVETASKPPKGLARFKRSLSLNASGKVNPDLDRLNGDLLVVLGHLSSQLRQHNSTQVPVSPQSSQSAASSSSSARSAADPPAACPATSLAASTLGPFSYPQRPSTSDINSGLTLHTSLSASPQPPPQQGDADAMVGMDGVVSEIMALLEARSEGRVVLLLHGLVGAGKTAAARATFERIGRGLTEGVLAHWVGLRAGLSTSELLARQRSMRWMLAGGRSAAVSEAAHTLEEGRSSMRGLLEGRKLLLVVDGASGSQLEELFPSDLMTLVAPGSILLLTSRDPYAAASLQLPPGSSALSYTVRPLPDELAVELFCRRAFKSAGPTALQATVVREAVEQCGGLPLAVEALAAAYSKGDAEPDLLELYGDGYANKLFKSLNEAVGRLRVEEREALHDVATFFMEADWGAVEAYCGAGVLAGLERSGLVEREAAGTVGVAYVVEVFCEAVQLDKAAQARLSVEREEDRDAALSKGVRGVCFHGVDLQLQASTQQRLDHRMLLLDGCMLHGQLQWSFQQLQWLSWRGPQMARGTPPVRMEPLVQAGLRVLLLEHLPFESIDLQSLPGLKHVILDDMPHLTAIKGLPQGTHIDLRSCPLLNSLQGSSLPPNLKHPSAILSSPFPTPPPLFLSWVSSPLTHLNPSC